MKPTEGRSLQMKKKGCCRRKILRVKEMFDAKAVQAHNKRLYQRRYQARKALLKHQAQLAVEDVQEQLNNADNPLQDTSATCTSSHAAAEIAGGSGTGRKQGRPRKRMAANDWLNERAVALNAKRRRERERQAAKRKAEMAAKEKQERRREQLRAAKKRYSVKQKALRLQQMSVEGHEVLTTSAQEESTCEQDEPLESVLGHSKVFENLRHGLLARRGSGRPSRELRQARHTIVGLAPQGPNPVTADQLAAELGVSKKYARKVLRQAQEIDPLGRPQTKKRKDALPEDVR